MALDKIIQKIKKRKRWLIDRKVKTPVAKQSSKFSLHLVPIYAILILLCWWEYNQYRDVQDIVAGIGKQFMAQEHYIKFLEGKINEKKSPIIFRPRPTKVETKTVYVTKYKTAPQSGWQHIPERRGAYIR